VEMSPPKIPATAGAEKKAAMNCPQ
jgi:hypothetical protein